MTKYSIEQIDELRKLESNRITWGRFNWGLIDFNNVVSSGAYREDELCRMAEERVRTYIQAGIMPEDLKDVVTLYVGSEPDDIQSYDFRVSSYQELDEKYKASHFFDPEKIASISRKCVIDGVETRKLDN